MERKALRREPQKAAERAIRWGAPILESQITLIANGRYYYRGVDAVELAATRQFEEVAKFIWTGVLDGNGGFSDEPLRVPDSVANALPMLLHLNPVERFQTALPLAQTEDVQAYVLDPERVARTGARIIRLLTWVAVGGAAHESTVAATLQAGWAADRPTAIDVFNRALILLADHEFNVSAFTARCVASAGSTPYAVVQAGLAALQGYKHGGAAERVIHLLSESPPGVRELISSRLRRVDPLPGFGHRLYPDGDPRHEALVSLLSAFYPRSPELERSREVASVVASLTGLKPNIDFALGTLCQVLKLAPGHGSGLFALARTAGWIAQAAEQYSLDTLIRPRAKYTGHLPNQLVG